MMRDTFRQYKEAAGKVVESVESYQERGELGVVGVTISLKFTDQTELNLFVGAHAEIAAEVLPARKQPVNTNGAKSRAVTG